MESTEADIKARKAVAWGALNNMTTIWKSHIFYSVKLKTLPGHSGIYVALWM